MQAAHNPEPIRRRATSRRAGLLSPEDKAKLDATTASFTVADEALVDQLVTATDWAAPTLATNWSNWGASNLAAGYKRDPTGRVWLRGTIKKAVALVAGETVFTLPVGFRPSATANYGVASNGAFGLVAVGNTGAVQVVVGNAAWVQLDGISFDTAG